MEISVYQYHKNAAETSREVMFRTNPEWHWAAGQQRLLYVGRVRNLRKRLTSEEAAGVLGVSTATIDHLTERGLLKPSRATRHPLSPVFENERLFKETQGKASA